MRRLMSVTTLVVAAIVTSAAPVAAAETSSTTGDAKGALAALILAAVLGAAVLIQAYRKPRFGGSEAHHDEAHDVREGFDGHRVPEPGVEDMPSGGPA